MTGLLVIKLEPGRAYDGFAWIIQSDGCGCQTSRGNQALVVRLPRSVAAFRPAAMGPTQIGIRHKRRVWPQFRHAARGSAPSELPTPCSAVSARPWGLHARIPLVVRAGLGKGAALLDSDSRS